MNVPPQKLKETRAPEITLLPRFAENESGGIADDLADVIIMC